MLERAEWLLGLIVVLHSCPSLRLPTKLYSALFCNSLKKNKSALTARGIVFLPVIKKMLQWKTTGTVAKEQ